MILETIYIDFHAIVVKVVPLSVMGIALATFLKKSGSHGQ